MALHLLWWARGLPFPETYVHSISHGTVHTHGLRQISSLVYRVCCGSSKSNQNKGPFQALVSALQDLLEACPAMPGVALETSIEDCLRRPSPGAASWSLGAARLFVGGVLSLVSRSRSPRSVSLCQAVVSVLVHFVAEKGCGLAGESSRPRGLCKVLRCNVAILLKRFALSK